MKKQDIGTLKQNYQVQRTTTTTHFITDDLSMSIETHFRINGNRTSDIRTYIAFDSKINGKIGEGIVFEILKEKYFKPEMVEW